MKSFNSDVFRINKCPRTLGDLKTAISARNFTLRYDLTSFGALDLFVIS